MVIAHVEMFYDSKSISIWELVRLNNVRKCDFTKKNTFQTHLSLTISDRLFPSQKIMQGMHP